MRNNFAFSLIELMVVIAIIALLSAVAIPTYKNYSTQSRLSSITNSVASIMSRMAEYRAIHGGFPSSTDLNLPVNPGDPVATGAFDHDIISPYILSASLGSMCSGYGFVVLSTDSSTIGTNTNTSDANYIDYLVATYSWFSVDGTTLTNKCFYTYQLHSGDFGTDELLPGCYNRYATYGGLLGSAIESDLLGTYVCN